MPYNLPSNVSMVIKTIPKGAKNMKIANISSTAIESPPSTYGGLEWISYLRARGLAELGEEVTLIAAKGSHAPEGVTLLETVDVGKPEEEAYKTYKDKLKEFDVIIDDSWQKWSYLSKVEDNKIKIMGVTHSQCPYKRAPPVKFPNFVAVSNAHAQYMCNKLGIPIRFVHNGIDLSLYPFQAEKSNYYLSLNRIMAEKGIHNFVDIIRRTRSKGRVAGEDKRLITDLSYPTRIQQACDGLLAQYWGAVSNEQKLKLLQNAKGLVALPLAPYLEVFGLSLVEAGCCGTPVIGLRNGAFPEIIKHGETGFVCETLNEVERVIKENQVEEIDPKACRQWIEENFTYQKMSQQYLKLCVDVIEGNCW